MIDKRATRDAYGQALVELAEKFDDFVVLDADLSRSTRTDWFAEKYPKRFYNMGISEQNMIGFAAGLSLSGLVSFATTYSIFIGRAFDQIRQSVCYANANVKIVATHSGLSAGHDGGSHQGLEDIALMRVLPGMTIISPADYNETRNALISSYRHLGPVYIRLGKYNQPNFTKNDEAFKIGKLGLLKKGIDVCVFATGSLVYEAILASKILSEENVSVQVVNVSTIKPLDSVKLIEYALSCEYIVTAEEHNIVGGLFSAVSETLAKNKIARPIEPVGMKDVFGETGAWEELLIKYKVNCSGIIEAVESVMR